MQMLSDYENKMEELSRKQLSVLQCGYWENCTFGIRTLRENGRPDYQLIYIDKGSLLINGKKYSAGSLYVFYPFEMQDYMTNEDGTDYYWIHYCGTEAKKYTPLKSVEFAKGNALKSFVKDAIKEYLSKKPLYKDKVMLEFMDFAVQVFRSAKYEKSRVEKAVSYISEHYTDPLVNREYAKMCGLSESAFVRAFKAKTGKTPNSFRVQLVTEAAKNLITSTTMSISEIAAILGFDDSFYFSRLFKKETGMSPLNYRKAAD